MLADPLSLFEGHSSRMPHGVSSRAYSCADPWFGSIEGAVIVRKPASISAALLLNSPAIPNSRRATSRSLQNCANRRQVAAW